MKHNRKIYLLFLTLILIFCSFQNEVKAQQIGYVALGDKIDYTYNTVDGENSKFKYNLILWQFISLHTVEEKVLKMNVVSVTDGSVLVANEINVAEGGAIGSIKLEKGSYRIEIRNSAGELYAKSNNFVVLDLKDI